MIILLRKEAQKVLKEFVPSAQNFVFKHSFEHFNVLTDAKA